MMTSTAKNEISLAAVVGKGYGKFWRSKLRYRVVKGSRASKKSTTTALNLIVRMMQYPEANALVVRKTLSTLKDSCYAQLKWAINRLGVGAYWKNTINPLQLEYIPTGQKILFRGLDDPMKITSITVEKGILCWLWVEEAYEINEDDFNRIDESLRGTVVISPGVSDPPRSLPPGYFLQCTLTFNPWSATSWLKARFFDEPRKNVLAITTTYKCNEWLSVEDHAMFEDMKEHDPERYKVAGLGDWGIAAGQYFREWRESLHVIEPFTIPDGWQRFRSMDWGSARPYAVYWWAVDFDGNLYAYRELYGYGGKPNVGTQETAKQVGARIAELEKPEEKVLGGVLDNACWAKTGVTGPTIAEELNAELYLNNLITFSKSSKGREEGGNAIKQRLIGNILPDGTKKPAIYFFRNCVHAIRTMPMLAHDEAKPECYDTKGEDHCFIAGTLVTTKRGKIPIEEVTTKDYVLTRCGFMRVKASAMTKTQAIVTTVTFNNGQNLTGTRNHPVFVIGKGFTELGEFKSGDKVMAEERAVFVVCSRKEPQRKAVYNLTVEGKHEYFANGILVHNCADAVAYACLSRPWTPNPKPKQKREDRWARHRRENEAPSAWAL